MKKIFRVYKIENDLGKAEGCLVEDTEGEMFVEYFKNANFAILI